MARVFYTVADLVSQVRSTVDELNQDSVDTEADILPALNRAQDFAFDVLARFYPEPLLVHATVPTVGAQAEYDIPEDCFEDRLLKVEVQVSNLNTFREVQRASYRDISDYETTSSSNVPYYYAVVGRKYRLVPAPSGTYPLRIWYLKTPEALLLPQGRVTTISTGSNYCVVDEVGSDLTTESDQLNSYVNWIDGQTGAVKGTLQIQSITDNRVTFRTAPTRTTVLNRTIETSLANLDTSQDDYLATVKGTCVPQYSQPTSNFLVQYATAEMQRKLGSELAVTEQNILEKFEQQIQRTWVGREEQLRIKKRSPAYGSFTSRRWFWDYNR